jgi:hypothetical protein
MCLRVARSQPGNQVIDGLVTATGDIGLPLGLCHALLSLGQPEQKSLFTRY